MLYSAVTASPQAAQESKDRECACQQDTMRESMGQHTGAYTMMESKRKHTTLQDSPACVNRWIGSPEWCAVGYRKSCSQGFQSPQLLALALVTDDATNQHTTQPPSLMLSSQHQAVSPGQQHTVDATAVKVRGCIVRLYRALLVKRSVFCGVAGRNHIIAEVAS